MALRKVTTFIILVGKEYSNSIGFITMSDRFLDKKNCTTLWFQQDINKED
jgi:hypothetical protein